MLYWWITRSTIGDEWAQDLSLSFPSFWDEKKTVQWDRCVGGGEGGGLLEFAKNSSSGWWWLKGACLKTCVGIVKGKRRPHNWGEKSKRFRYEPSSRPPFNGPRLQKKKEKTKMISFVRRNTYETGETNEILFKKVCWTVRRSTYCKRTGRSRRAGG